MTGSSLPQELDRPPRRRSVRLWWRTWEWLVIGVAAFIGLVLGYIGTWLYFRDAPAWNRHPWEILYRTIQLLPLQFGWFEKPLHWTLQVARFLLPAIAVYAAVKGLAALYFEQLQALRVRLYARNHTIICGLGQKGLTLARKLRRRGNLVVIIEHDAENDLIRAARDLGCVVMLGDATEKHMLSKAGVAHARHLVAVCRDDGVNAQIAVGAKRFVEEYGGNLHCACHIFDAHLMESLKGRAPKGNGSFRLEFHNIYEEGATKLLELDRAFPPDSADACPGALVIGVGRMGQKLLVELARRWQAVGGKKPLRITLVDNEAQAKQRYLLSTYHGFEDAWELLPFELDIRSAKFLEGEFLAGPAAEAIQRVYVCLDDDSLGMMAAFQVRDMLKPRRQVPIVVRTRHEYGLAELVDSIDEKECLPDCVMAFALHEHTCRPEDWLDRDTGPDKEKGNSA